MSNAKLFHELRQRRLIAQTTHPELLQHIPQTRFMTLYCGFDPTADSLHVGHLLILLCLKRFQLHGHRPIVLIGNGTGMIGDPSFRLVRRKLSTFEETQAWTKKIAHQVSSYLDFRCGKNSAIVVRNLQWLKNIKLIDFLNTFGRRFSVRSLIQRRSMQTRIQQKTRVSFSELAYALLQSYDFLHLQQKYNAVLQIGGSDQWGNIVSGVRCVERMCKRRVYGLTLPIITRPNGVKFGKTGKQTIWLNSTKTSVYQFYQFWINTPDEDVCRFLRFFTFVDVETIHALRGQTHKKNLQKLLAEQVTKIVHGNHGFNAAKRISDSLFSHRMASLTKADLALLNQDGTLSITERFGIDLQSALVNAKFVASRGQARNAILSRSVSINGSKTTNIDYVLGASDTIHGQYTLLRHGKKHFCLINWK